MKVLILAGGLGTRLSEETDILPVTISERLIDGFNLGDMIGIVVILSVIY